MRSRLNKVEYADNVHLCLSKLL